MAKNPGELTWRKGAHVPAGLDVDEVGRELEELLGEEGKVTPEAVVERAANERSALHGWFVWDDTEAASLYRLQQARTLLKAVHIVVEKDETRPIVFNVRVQSDDQVRAELKERHDKLVSSYYRRAEDLPRHKVELLQVLADAVSRVAAAEKVVVQLNKLAGESGDQNLAMISLAATSLAAARESIERVSIQ